MIAASSDQPERIRLRLAYREPFAYAELLAFLAARAVPGIEEVAGRVYRRTLSLPRGGGVLELGPHASGWIEASFRLDDQRDLGAALTRTRHLADLDAEPAEIDATLHRDPIIGARVRAVPGMRVPRTVDGEELAVRAVLGQQVTVRAARTLAARLVARLGEPLPAPDGGLTHRFPTSAALAEGDLDGLGLTGARVAAIRTLARALVHGAVRVDADANRFATERALLRLPGVGQWTASYVALRALGDSDAFMPTDLGVRRALEHAGVAGDPAAAMAVAEHWRPFRAYGLVHLWASR